MVTELYDALLQLGCSEDLARAAADSVPSCDSIGVDKGTRLVVALYEAFRAAPTPPDESVARTAASAVAFHPGAKTISLGDVATPPGQWIST